MGNISEYAATLFTGRTACTDATAHLQHGHHRTTSCTTCSVPSPGRCTPQRRARCLDTTAPGRRSRLPGFPSQHLVPQFYSRWAAHRRATRVTPNETVSQKARCKRKKLLPVPLRRRRAPTTCRRSRFPGVEAQRSRAAALSRRHEALAAALL